MTLKVCSYYHLHPSAKLDADMLPVALMASESGSHAVNYTMGIKSSISTLIMQMRLYVQHSKLACPLSV